MIIHPDQLRETLNNFEKEYFRRSDIVKSKINNGSVIPDDYGWFNMMVFALNNANDILKEVMDNAS